MAGRCVIIGRGRVRLIERDTCFWRVIPTQPRQPRSGGCRVGRAPSRVSVVGGSPLLRQALAALLARVGFIVTDGPQAEVVLVAEGRDLSLDEMLACRLPLVVLSAAPDPAAAVQLLEERPEGTAYLASSRVPDGRMLAIALRAVAAGDSLLDAGVGDGLTCQDANGVSDDLTPRERQILSLMAEGRSNQDICNHLVLSPKTIETHVTRIFSKLGLPTDDTRNRRVTAVLRYLQDRALVSAAAA